MALIVSLAQESDIPLLTELNFRLREDENADNVFTMEQLEQRMRKLLSETYRAYLFREQETVIGYALIDFGRQPVYLRQFYIEREYRRQGRGREAFHLILQRENISEMDVEVYLWNDAGKAFWTGLGFKPRYLGLRYQSK